MTSKYPAEYFELLNKGVARELQVSVQYMLQHTKMEKLKRRVIQENLLLEATTYDTLGGMLRKFAIEEMKHAAQIMERIYILGGDATTKSTKVVVGDTLKEFSVLDVKAEEEALELYDQIVKKANELGDQETKRMFERIFSEEEIHLLAFQDYAEVESEPDMGEAPAAEWMNIFDDAYIKLLNKALASEITAIIQYTNQHEKASREKARKKVTSLEMATDKNKEGVVSDLLKPILMQEMDHMEKISERIYQIKKEAVSVPDPLPEIGAAAENFILLDRKAESDAIILYRQIIAEATKRGDHFTKDLFEKIILEEEDHFWKFDEFMP